MGLLHMVFVKVEGCNPQKADEIVRACRKQWKKLEPRDEMSRIDKGSPSEPSACVSIFAWVYFPDYFQLDVENGFVDRVGFAAWKANGDYCHVHMVVEYVPLNDRTFADFSDALYEAIQTGEIVGARRLLRLRKLTGIKATHPAEPTTDEAQPIAGSP